MICNFKKYDELNRKYKLIAFDWDGTAVVNRKADAAEVCGILEKLLYENVIIVIITGTNVNNIQNQIKRKIASEVLKNLYILTNRGSESFGYNDNGELMLLYRRKATAEENNILDKVAEKTRDGIVGSSNAIINIIYDRLNRRKIDLIPQWQDPPKSEIDKLLIETEKNLKFCGYSGGIKKAYELLKMNARSYNFKDARITCDVKHLEIGLTDKSDSIKWIIKNITEKHGIKQNEILVGGDEFGTIAGFEGSDYRMVLKDCPEITYFSVGKEPEGTPKGVLDLKGGPECFSIVLQNQLML